MSDDVVQQSVKIDSGEQLKALSVRQPSAELILRGDKDIEYRTQATNIRGRIYIYASLGKSDVEDEANVEKQIGRPISELPRGVVVGTVELSDCTGSDGEYEWHLQNPHRLNEPLAPKEQPQPMWFHPFATGGFRRL